MTVSRVQVFILGSDMRIKARFRTSEHPSGSEAAACTDGGPNAPLLTANLLVDECLPWDLEG